MLSRAVPSDDRTLNATSTYIGKDDSLMASLTIRETVEFAAKLALPDSISRRERETRIEDVLRDFGLSSIKNRKIRNCSQKELSRKQKKKVTLASRLIASPKIVFLGTWNSTYT